MKQLFAILLLLAGFLMPPVIAAYPLLSCGDLVAADADPKPDEEEEEPDCD